MVSATIRNQNENGTVQEVEFDSNNPVPVETTDPVYVPAEFTKLTSNTGASLIQKGNLNKIKFTPRVLNEHAESSREIQATVTSTNTVGQVFKASKNNISALMISLESAAGIALDNFESYANSGELQAVWVKSGTSEATLEESIVKTGDKAMSLPCGLLDGEWVDTITLTDYTDFTGSFDAYFTNTFAKVKVSVFIGDGINTKSLQLTQPDRDLWTKFEVSEAAMSEDSGGTTNVAAITKIGFRVDEKDLGSVCIIDNLAATPPPGDVKLKLWDMGTTKPVIGVTSIDDGAQYTQMGAALAASYDLSLLGGFRVYHVHQFTAGINKSVPSNELLNIGHYYIFQIEYVDTDVNVYGPDTSFGTQYYNNGFAFTAPDESTAISATTAPADSAYSDLMFGIFSAQDVYFTSVTWRFDAAPNGGSAIHVFLESTDMKITDVVVDHEVAPEQEFTTDISLRPMLLEDGGKLEFYYNDDHTDSVSKVIGEAKFLYEPPIVNG